MNIGIIGKGFVGSAVQFGFSPNTGCDANVKVYDKDPNKSQNTLEEVMSESDFIFFLYQLRLMQMDQLILILLIRH